MTWADCEAYIRAECVDGQPPMAEATVRYAMLLWVLSEAIAAKTVLEVGVGPTCVSGMTFAHSMASRGGGTLISVDVDPMRPTAMYRGKARSLGVTWDVHHGDSREVAAAEFSHDPDLEDQVDLLYIDGDHTMEYAVDDTLNYLPQLRRGGYLVIDDYPTSDGVVEAKKMLDRFHGFTFVHLAHEPPHGNGRLLWQKTR